MRFIFWIPHTPGAVMLPKTGKIRVTGNFRWLDGTIVKNLIGQSIHNLCIQAVIRGNAYIFYILYILYFNFQISVLKIKLNY